MKKFLLSGAALLIASTLAVAAPVKVGVSIANFDDTFLTYMMDGMKAYAKAHPNDVQLTFTDAKEDMAKQLDQVENFIVQKMDAIIVVPVDTSATAPMTKNMLAKNIKAVYVNRNPGNLPDGAYYVGSEEIVAGRLQMEFLGEKLKGKGNVAILIGKLDNEVKVSFVRTGAGDPQEFLGVYLKNTGVSGLSFKAAGGSGVDARPGETLHLNFGKIEVKYNPIGDDLTGSPSSTTWNIETQTK